jgi:hypothetical protein
MIDFTKKTLLSTLLVLGATAVAGCDGEALVLQDNPAAEEAYEELTRRWLVWAMAQPYTQSAINDQTGERCAVDQDHQVWMLAGTHGGPVTRSCDIPAQTPLFFPLINRWVMPGLDPSYEPADVPGFIAWVEGYFALQRSRTCSLTLTLDGEPLLADTEEIDQELYVAVQEPFEVELNDDNWATAYGKQGGLYSFVFIDGHYALLRPLPPGDHVLEFGGTTCNAAGAVLFTTSAVYELHVAGPGEGEDEEDEE